ncbi:MAG: DEAD/DEAH box helicase family protein, partial [Candidatus Izemoplasmatales bacterium]|nr:DEAD/DEAH box helicase family protein [Candidatus Izemoplasmatales bacterium]
MEIIVSNKVIISNAPEDVKARIKKYLTLENPVYNVMLRNKKIRALYAVPKYFKYYKEDDFGLCCGRGVLHKILESFSIPMGCIKYDLCNSKLNNKYEAQPNLQLRDYQVGVAEKIISTGSCGIIKLSTGYGKTIIALRLIELLQKKTLIIVHRDSILKQFVNDAKEFYNYNLGIIQGNNWDIRDITIASIDTLNRRELRDIKEKFGMIIIDEAHTFISKKRLETIQSFNPQYLYGMSGTPDRSDGQGKAIQFTFGKILIDKQLPQKNPTVEIIRTDIPIMVQEYALMIEEQVNNR